jgi:periplasmic divalent cation tolerance protein
MERAVLVYTTYPALVEAERSGRLLVERRLAASVNILPGAVSYYWWSGKVERAAEVVMIAKTQARQAGAVQAAIRELHSYVTPAILTLAVEGIDPEYLAWLLAETRAP